MNLNRLRHHIGYLRHQLGQRLLIGGRSYKVAGYLANPLSTDLSHEPHVAKVFARVLEARDGAVLDVGVNLGQTLMKVLSVDPTRSYVGFEPQYGCCFMVDRFIRDNNLSNASVLCIALSNSNKMISIYSKSQFDDQASSIKSSTRYSDKNSKKQYVSARMGDDIVKEIGINSISVIKVDVEGAELNVFSGLRRVIEEFRPVCFFEVLANVPGDPQVSRSDNDASRSQAAADKLWSLFRGCYEPEAP